MRAPSEGKDYQILVGVQLTEKDVDQALERLFAEEEEFPVRDVLGVMDVAHGAKVEVPTTIYMISGDDTSGIAGLLKPDGEFIRARLPRREAAYWEHEETLEYRKDAKGRVRGFSWTKGEVVWDGSVAGSVDSVGEDGDRHGPVNKRVRDGSLGGDWETNGELWRAVTRGTAMR